MSSGVESEKRKAQANLSKLTRFLSSKRQDEQYAELLEKFNNLMISMDLDIQLWVIGHVLKMDFQGWTITVSYTHLTLPTIYSV